MAKLTVNTNGQGIELTDARIITTVGGDSTLNWMLLTIGDITIDIDFESSTEMIEFCEKHNFKYSDDRKTTPPQQAQR